MKTKMKEKIYGMLFALVVLCMVLSLMPTSVKGDAKMASRERSWHTHNSGSWAIDVSYAQVGVGISNNFKDSHGAQVAMAVKAGDLNYEFGTIGWYAMAFKDVSEDEETIFDDHWWTVHYQKYKPVKWNDYYTNINYNMVHHHWRSHYKVEHEVGEWPWGGHTDWYQASYETVIGVQCSSGIQ